MEDFGRFQDFTLQNPEFKILPECKILAFQNPEFKILAEFMILGFPNPDLKIF